MFFVIFRLSGIRNALSDVIATYVANGVEIDPMNPVQSGRINDDSSDRTECNGDHIMVCDDDHVITHNHTPITQSNHNTTTPSSALPIDKILESISRTRIGEYCYNLLRTIWRYSPLSALPSPPIISTHSEGRQYGKHTYRSDSEERIVQGRRGMEVGTVHLIGLCILLLCRSRYSVSL